MIAIALSDTDVAISRGKSDMQDKGSCGLGDMCLLTGQVGGLASTDNRSCEGYSEAYFTPFQSCLSNTSPLLAELKWGPDLHNLLRAISDCGRLKRGWGNVQMRPGDFRIQLERLERSHHPRLKRLNFHQL